MFKRLSPLFKLNSRKLLSAQKTERFNWIKQEKILMEPFEYINKLPLKYHTKLPAAFNHWLQVPEEKFNAIQEALRTMMSWNILIDDIQDDTVLRYGLPAAHRAFGLDLTVNAASKALLLGQKQIMNLGHPLGIEVFLKRTEEYLDGQGTDIYWRNNCICPSEEAHIEMAKKKNGSIMAFAVEIMQLFSSRKEDYLPLSVKIGVYYNNLDDYYNLFNQNELPNASSVKQDNHSICTDITESKITLPIIHASQFPDVAGELADILKQRTTDPKLVNRAISLLKKHGSDEYMRNKLRTMESEIRQEIDQLGGNEALSAFVDHLCLRKDF